MKFWSIVIIAVAVIVPVGAQGALRSLSADELNAVIESLNHQPTGIDTPAEAPTRCWWNGCRRSFLFLPVIRRDTDKLHSIKIPIYFPAKSAGRDVPIVLISATIEGETLLEKTIVRQLNSRGVAAAILDVNSFAYEPGLAGVKKIYSDSLFAVNVVRTFIDWLKALPKDGAYGLSSKSPISLLGLSNGSLTATATAAVDRRVQSTVLVGAIGDIPHIYAYSTLQKIVEFRERTMSKENLSPMEIERFLDENIPADPVHVAHLIPPRQIFQVIMTNDTTVPTEDQLKLWERLRRPAHLALRTDHFWGLVNVATIYFDQIASRLTGHRTSDDNCALFLNSPVY